MDSALDAYASPRNDERDSLRHGVRSTTLSPRHSGARVARARNPSSFILRGTMDSGLDAARRPGMTTENELRSVAYDTCAFCPSCQSVATRRVLPYPPNQSDDPRIPFPRRGAARDRHG